MTGILLHQRHGQMINGGTITLLFTDLINSAALL